MAGHDAIVVGGGVVGAATAYYLVAAGVRTLLVDRRDAGRATDAGAGILSTARALDHHDPVERFEAQAAKDYPALIERLAAAGAGHTGHAICGALTVTTGPEERAAFAQIRAKLERWPGAAAAGYTVLDAAQARARFPPLDGLHDGLHGALHCAHGARIDGRLLAAALLRSASAQGLELRTATVDAVLVAGGVATGVMIAGQATTAGHVVLAAGAWTATLGRKLGVTIPVTPLRGQIAHLLLPNTDTSDWPIVKGLRHHYMVPWPEGRIVVGATREASAGFDPRVTVAGVQEVLAEALRVAPGLRQATLSEVRVGLRPASPDGRPILGPVPGVARLLLATGHGAVGLQLGPYSGKMIAKTIIDGAPAAALEPFGLARLDPRRPDSGRTTGASAR